MIPRKLSWMLVAGAYLIFGCGGETGTNPQDLDPDPDTLDSTVCTEPVDLTVSSGTTPTFSWVPNCKLGRLIVLDGDLETWGTETLGDNTYESPIVYGVHPPNSAEEQVPVPLIAGRTYTVSVYRWFTVTPESLVIVGETDFTP